MLMLISRQSETANKYTILAIGVMLRRASLMRVVYMSGLETLRTIESEKKLQLNS